jgi:NTE family protein
VPSAIPLGARAALAVAPQLARYSVSPEAYDRWRAQVSAKSTDEPNTVIVNTVRVVGLDRVNPAVVEHQIEARPGEPLTSAQIARDAQRIFSRGDFEKVDYSIKSDAGLLTLEFQPLEKALAPDYLRFDLGLMSNTGGDTGFILRGEHTRTWINALGGHWSNTLQVGRTALIETSVFQPLDLRQRYFVEPQLRASRELQDIFRGDESVARYELDTLEGSIEAGTSLGTWGEFRLGISRSLTDFTSDIGAVVLPEVDDSDLGGLTSRFTVDTRDSPFLPTRGDFMRLDVYSSQEWLGAEELYHRGELIAQHVLPFRRGMMHLLAAGGSDFGSNAPAYDLFSMRGVRQLAGYQFDELRGREYGLARIAYMYKVSDLQSLFGQALYAGISAEAGNMFERADGGRAEGAILGSSLMFGGRTPLGPMLIVIGFAEGGKNSVYLQIGRPLEEP